MCNIRNLVKVLRHLLLVTLEELEFKVLTSCFELKPKLFGVTCSHIPLRDSCWPQQKTSVFWKKKRPNLSLFFLNFYVLQMNLFKEKGDAALKSAIKKAFVFLITWNWFLKCSIFSVFTTNFNQIRAWNFLNAVFWVPQLSLTLTLFTKERQAFKLTFASKNFRAWTNFNTCFVEVYERWNKRLQIRHLQQKWNSLREGIKTFWISKKQIYKTQGLPGADLEVLTENVSQAVVFQLFYFFPWTLFWKKSSHQNVTKVFLAPEA